jgi:hypothetical protein
MSFRVSKPTGRVSAIVMAGIAGLLSAALWSGPALAHDDEDGWRGYHRPRYWEPAPPPPWYWHHRRPVYVMPPPPPPVYYAPPPPPPVYYVEPRPLVGLEFRIH